MVSPFILPCLPFSLISEQKVRNRWRDVNKLYDFYLLHHVNGQMHVSLIASCVKIITKHIAVVYRFKAARMVSCWDLYVCSWAVICQYSWCYQVSMTVNWKIISSCTDSCHKPWNIHFMFERINLHVFLPVIYQYRCFFVLKSTWQQA